MDAGDRGLAVERDKHQSVRIAGIGDDSVAVAAVEDRASAGRSLPYLRA
jgi:hypothetical protein